MPLMQESPEIGQPNTRYKRSSRTAPGNNLLGRQCKLWPDAWFGNCRVYKTGRRFVFCLLNNLRSGTFRRGLQGHHKYNHRKLWSYEVKTLTAGAFAQGAISWLSESASFTLQTPPISTREPPLHWFEAQRRKSTRNDPHRRGCNQVGNHEVLALFRASSSVLYPSLRFSQPLINMRAD